MTALLVMRVFTHEMEMNMNAIKLIALVIIASVGTLAYTLFAPLNIPKEGAIVYVHPGMSRANLVADLSASQLTHLSPIFELYTLAVGKSPKSGEYLIHPGSTPYSVWHQLIKGTGRFYREFVIVPGSTFAQIKANLQNNPYLKHLTTNMSDRDLMVLLGDPAHGPEGLLMPETYYFTRGDVDVSILKRAHDLMNVKLQEAWNNRAADLPYTDVYQVLIAASLIEKEAYLAKEQPIISGVLVNRLRKNMLLQFDPTIIYGLGAQYQGKIYKKDLTTDTPYNTYMHKGLPPTPIAMPGLGAIRAAAHPAQHDFYYFVATGDGSHQFTTNLQDHYEAVEKAEQKHEQQIVTTPAAAGANHAIN